MQTLCDLVQTDVLHFLQTNDELLFNERDFQMHLATWLRRSKNGYDDVDLEYFVPQKELSDYVWDSELRLDIVVKKDGEFLPVELKYKTKRVDRKITRFDELLPTSVPVMKNQSAQNLGMYDFWKDVRRIELVRKRFLHVKNGLAVFVTNDPMYTKKSRESSGNFLFNMCEGTHGRLKNWANMDSRCAQEHPAFEVEKEYSIHWRDKLVDGEKFYFCIIAV